MNRNGYDLKSAEMAAFEVANGKAASVWSSKQLELALASQAHPGANLSSLFAHPNASFYASLYASSLHNAQESHSAQNGSQVPLSFLPPSAFQSAFHQMKSQPNSSSNTSNLSFDWLTKEMLCHHSNGKSVCLAAAAYRGALLPLPFISQAILSRSTMGTRSPCRKPSY